MAHETFRFKPKEVGPRHFKAHSLFAAPARPPICGDLWTMLPRGGRVGERADTAAIGQE